MSAKPVAQDLAEARARGPSTDPRYPIRSTRSPSGWTGRQLFG